MLYSWNLGCICCHSNCNTDVVYTLHMYCFLCRIQMTISLPSTVNDESQIRSLLPLCIMLARPVYSPAVVEVEFCSTH